MENTKKKITLTIKWIIIILLIAFLASSFCFFINQMWIPLGILLGMVISIINLMILYEFSYYLTRPYANFRWLSFLSYIVRLLLYGIGFLICILLERLGFKIFFWGSCLAAYLISIGVITVVFKK